MRQETIEQIEILTVPLRAHIRVRFVQIHSSQIAGQYERILQPVTTELYKLIHVQGFCCLSRLLTRPATLLSHQ